MVGLAEGVRVGHLLGFVDGDEVVGIEVGFVGERVGIADGAKVARDLFTKEYLYSSTVWKSSSKMPPK